MATARLFIRFTVPGTAQPRGSKTIGRKKDGSSFIRDDNPESRAWMNVVSKAAKHAMWDARKRPTARPVVLKLTIYRVRPKGHFGSGANADKVRGAAPQYPTTRPDLTKCVRGIEDAMNEVVWMDDAQVVDQMTSKRFGVVERVVIEVFELLATVAEFEGQRQGQGVLV